MNKHDPEHDGHVASYSRAGESLHTKHAFTSSRRNGAMFALPSQLFPIALINAAETLYAASADMAGTFGSHAQHVPHLTMNTFCRIFCHRTVFHRCHHVFCSLLGREKLCSKSLTILG